MTCKIDVAAYNWGDTFGNCSNVCKLFKLNPSKTGYLKKPSSFLRNSEQYEDCLLSMTRIRPNATEREVESSQSMHDQKIIQVYFLDKLTILVI